MIDLHTHTTESDGTFSPTELVEAAAEAKLDALAISDHDTMSGYDMAVQPAKQHGLDLICGIELSTRLPKEGTSRGKTVHLLGYFVDKPPTEDFRQWLRVLQASRRDRNARLARRLQSIGVDITLEEVEAKGRSLAGRPHFARLLLEKRYVKTLQEAFDVYLDESAQAYVYRDEPSVAEGIRRIATGAGLPVLAHPIRLGKRNTLDEEKLVRKMIDAGLQGIEVFHSDHSPADVERFQSYADRYGLAVTGGSDFHGENKPDIRLGTGMNGNLSVPREVLDRLRASRQ